MKNNKYSKEIGLNVQTARLKEGLTQEQLAVDIDVSPEFYRKFESTLGSEGISLTNVYKISVVLDIRIDKLFEKESKEKTD